MYMEAAVIPAHGSRHQLVVLQDTPPENRMTTWADRALDSIRPSRHRLSQLMKEWATSAGTTTVTNTGLPPLSSPDPASSPPTINTGTTGEEDTVRGGLAIDLFAPEPTFHVALQCPVSDRSYDMSLATAAVMLGLMIGAPINPTVAFIGFIKVGGTVISVVSDEAVWEAIMYGMRKANPPIQYLFMGYPRENIATTMRMIDGWAYTQEAASKGCLL